MALDLKAWLTDLGITDAAVLDTLVPALTPASQKIEEGFLRQSDYSRKSTELQTAQTALTAANERLNAEILDWTAEKNSGGVVTEQMRNDFAKAQGEVTRLTSIIQTKATELGLDPKTIIGESPAVIVPEPKPAPVNMDGYIKADQIGRFADMMLTIPAELQSIAQEHFDLTGERIDVRPLVTEFKTRMAATRQDPAKPADVRRIWEDQYQIPAKREAVAVAAHAAEIKTAEDRGYERRATEQAIPGANPPGRHSPIFARSDANKSKLERPSNTAKAANISHAAQMLASHKYAGYRGDRKNPVTAGS